jgi:large subunit ribosomal protein L4
MMLKNFSGNLDPAGEVEAPAIFESAGNEHVMHLALLRELANARVGTHSTKTRSEVSGGGKKPWRQKHTGRARQGSNRAPQWRHGGIVFGPHPRSYAQDMPARVRRLALRSVLSEKMRSGQVLILDQLALEAPKTKFAAALFKRLSLSPTAIFIVPGESVSIQRAFRNIPHLHVGTAGSVSIYDMLRFRNVVIVKDALPLLAKRCGEGRA